MVSSNSVNVAQHRAIQDTSDPLPLLLQPRQNQSFNHLLGRKERSQGLGSQRLPGGRYCPLGYDASLPQCFPTGA